MHVRDQRIEQEVSSKWFIAMTSNKLDDKGFRASNRAEYKFITRLTMNNTNFPNKSILEATKP